jgi:hypothetical protein
MVALPPGEPGRPVLHVRHRGLQHDGDRHGAGGVGAVGVEDGPAVGQLHQLGIGGQDPGQTGLQQREDGPDQAPQQRGLARPGGACDQDVRHLREVRGDVAALDVLAQAHEQRVVVGGRGARAEHVAEGHVLPVEVRDLHPDRALARYRAHDAHVR